MNWKKILAYVKSNDFIMFGCCLILLAGAVSVISVAVTKYRCEKKANAQISKKENEIYDNRFTIDVLRDSVSMLSDMINIKDESILKLQDSASLYKEKWKDCEDGKKRCVTPKKPRTQPRTAPVKPVVVPSKPKPVRDTVFVVLDVNPDQKDGKENVTKIDLDDKSRNNENIVVQNANQNGSNTEIKLNNGSVNNGNIVVNNGGSVKIESNRQAIDSLRMVVDSLKNKSNGGCSVVYMKRKITTYRRTR